ncbi:DUF2975 domain-containing protein [Patiriisocius hiemis]|uniref:DUF2975 domain-containing protein n=1 Tax=Patiriisocius hiemis TaxID=3075604 RepID=A0ABU2Y993_9FLAO|nr:DUF2975 domain-containing protein [Constantimarinum sp. W242]MDT0554748.1 DUF2975 domain-containing protein [Constantimarinum sp. W242]
MTTKRILKIMYIITWIIFIGLSLRAVGTVLAYIISFVNEGAVKDLYKEMNLLVYKQNSITQYTIIVGYRLIQFSIQAYIAFLVTKLLSNLNIQRPFNTNALKQMQKISYSLLSLWAIVVIHNFHVGFLEASTGISAKLLSSEFVYIVGIVYVFSLLFKRGIELQSESDLTI